MKLFRTQIKKKQDPRSTKKFLMALGITIAAAVLNCKGYG
jgi:hypothetical protein